MIIVTGESGAGTTTLVKKLEKFLSKAEPQNKLKTLETDFSEGLKSVLETKTAGNVTSLFRKSSEGSHQEKRILIDFDGPPEDLPKHLYKIAEFNPIKTAAKPTKECNAATNCGISVICTRRAKIVPITEPTISAGKR